MQKKQPLDLSNPIIRQLVEYEPRPDDPNPAKKLKKRDQYLRKMQKMTKPDPHDKTSFRAKLHVKHKLGTFADRSKEFGVTIEKPKLKINWETGEVIAN